MGKPRLTPEQRGPIGAWAYERRSQLGWTDEVAVARLLDEQGVKMRASSLRTIETGHYLPAPDVLAALEALYGSQAPQVAPRTGRGGDAALWAAVEALRATVETLEARLAADEAALADHQARRHVGRTPDGSRR